MDLRNPHFAEPGWLWLAILAPAALLLLNRHAARARKRQIAAFAAPELLGKLLLSHSPVRRAIKNLLLLLAVAGIGVAMARPQWGVTTEISEALGEDVLFIVDCSRSMLVGDVPPNRLDRAKYAILDFVQKHGQGRVGLVAFSGEAFLQCPLTFDYDAFREAVLALDDKTIPVPGTDIGRALDEADHAMESSDRHKVMILLTDGEDLEQTGIGIAQKLAKNGVVIHTVGVGTPNGGVIRFFNEQGAVDVWRDKQGNVVQSRLDENTLKAIAATTKGSYQPLGPLGEGLTHIRQYIETAPHSIEFSRARRMGVDRYFLPVGIVTLLLFLEPLLGTRRRQAAALLAGLLVLSAHPVAAQESDPQNLSPRQLYNDGTKKLMAGKLSDAETSLEAALTTQDERVMPPALYNLGETRFRKGFEQLKKAGDGSGENDAGGRAVGKSDDAILSADAALAGGDLDSIVSAYMQARGARKDLKGATEAVKQAMEKFGAVIRTWQRAAGDFDGAHELIPADKDAANNAAVVRKNIAKLIDLQQMLQMTMEGMGRKRGDLKKKMGELKKKMPKNPGGETPGGGKDDEDEDDEDEGKQKKGPEQGQDEQFQKEGREMSMTQEEAERLLNMLKLDSNRKLGFGTNELRSPGNRKGRDW